MPMRGELPIATARASIRQSVAESFWSNCLAIISNRDLQCVGAFCAIGLLLTINLILMSPDFAATVVSLQMLP